MTLKRLLAICCLLSAGFAFPAHAHAYLDPGTGSYVLQLVLATIVGALFAVTLFWRRIKLFFKNLFSPQENDKHDEE